MIAADKMGDFSIAKMKADYENMVRLALSSPKSPGRRRRTAREMGSIATHTAIEELRKPLGAFNWCLFKGLKGGELDFLNAGSMSLHEMQDWLKPDEVRPRRSHPRFPPNLRRHRLQLLSRLFDMLIRSPCARLLCWRTGVLRFATSWLRYRPVSASTRLLCLSP